MCCVLRAKLTPFAVTYKRDEARAHVPGLGFPLARNAFTSLLIYTILSSLQRSSLLFIVIIIIIFFFHHSRLLAPICLVPTAVSSQNLVTMTNAILPRPMTFLTLAPATSSSYPQPQAQAQRASIVLEGSAVASGPAAEGEAPAPVQRRSSSVSSTGFRILKLGPVHWGEHLGEEADKGDFVDVPSP